MRFRFTLAFVLFLAAPVGVGLQAADGPYSKIAEIPVGGAARFDYLTVDSAAKRLYLTHGTEVVVIDTGTNTVVGKIADTPGVHGIAIAPGGRGFTSNGTENKVSIVDLKTLQTLAKSIPARIPTRFSTSRSRKKSTR